MSLVIILIIFFNFEKADEFEENGSQINPKTMKNVPFTVSFIKEALRLAHVLDVLVPREALIDVQLPNGIVMPAGTNFAVDLSALQLSEARFFNKILIVHL